MHGDGGVQAALERVVAEDQLRAKDAFSSRVRDTAGCEGAVCSDEGDGQVVEHGLVDGGNRLAAGRGGRGRSTGCQLAVAVRVFECNPND